MVAVHGDVNHSGAKAIVMRTPAYTHRNAALIDGQEGSCVSNGYMPDLTYDIIAKVIHTTNSRQSANDMEAFASRVQAVDAGLPVANRDKAGNATTVDFDTQWKKILIMVTYESLCSGGDCRCE